jgi:hypothetical protein
MITNVRGEFEKLRGEVTYDAANPEATRIEATIDVASLNTREAKRDADLKSALFFDVENPGEMTFVSKSSRAVGEARCSRRTCGSARSPLSRLSARKAGEDVEAPSISALRCSREAASR